LSRSKEDPSDNQVIVTDYHSLLATKPQQRSELPSLNKVPRNMAAGEPVSGDDWSSRVDKDGSVGGEHEPISDDLKQGHMVVVGS